MSGNYCPLLIAMVGITRIASVIERLDETANDTDVELRLAQAQHTAVARQDATVEITLKVVTLGFYHLSRFRCSDLGCWVYYENTLPSPPRSEYRPSVPCGGSRA